MHPGAMESRTLSLSRRLARSPLAAVAYFAALALALTDDALFGRGALGPEALLDRDALYQTGPLPVRSPLWDYTPIAIDYPRDLAFAEGLRAGRLDAWNPLAGCGTPLWADHVGPFFPLKLPFYLAPSRQTYQLFLALRLVLAAAGAYFLARWRGLGFAPSLAAGASFEVSGALLGHLAFASASPVYVLPWIVLGAGEVARRPTARAAAGAGIALGLAGHGGHPALVLLVFAAFAAAVGAEVVTRSNRPREALAIGAWALAAVVVGLALAAPTLLPLAELTARATSYKSRLRGQFIQAMSLIESRDGWPIALFAPGMLERLLRGVGKLHPFGAAVGVLALVTAVAGLLCRGSTPGLIGVAALGLTLALEPPGLGWFAQLPGTALILPAYAWALVALFLSQAAGRGVQAAASARERWTLLLAFALVLCAGMLLLPFGSRPGKFARMFHTALARPDGLTRLLLPAAYAGIAVALCVVAGRTRFAARAAAVLALLIPLEPIFLMLPMIRQPRSQVLYEPPSPTVRFLQAELASGSARMMGLPRHVGLPLTPMLFGLRDFRNTSVLQVARFNDYLEVISPRAVEFNFQGVAVPTSPLLDLAAVRYVVMAAPDPRKPSRAVDRDPALRVVHRDGGLLVYDNAAALERVRIAHDSVSRAGPEEAAAWLASAASAARHARDGVLASTVVLEPAAGGVLPPTLSGHESSEGRVRIVPQPDPDRLMLEAELTAPGFVVIADAYYPGWKAWVDGRPAAIFPADLLFRAVAVPAGAHALELRYHPPSLRYGAVLFAAAAALCAFVLARGGRSTPVSG